VLSIGTAVGGRGITSLVLQRDFSWYDTLQ
jgi:hypothetical protein